ncbi:Glycolipid transfer protein-like [Oopsacas minuta]|uniref:Glycolipid transfer protein-like n=1 Tax=Oopsacas minuta TaxID=111878 RepID=A0AAV7KM47_9METZ|nr:Glycolipid transfer protein-like [Oopsacas minuta]KAI6662038.1 Glycolipid transfer protein-like [Oopsacas minuta]
MNYFQSIPNHFPDIEEGGWIPTDHFLTACNTFITFTDLLGPVLSRAKDSVTVNINILRKRYDRDNTKYMYLHELILDEDSEPDPAIYISLIWLKRAIEFIYIFLKQLTTSTHTSLPQDAYHAYQISLKPYHGFIIRSLVYMLINIAPSKDNLINTLVQGSLGGREQLFLDINEYIKPMATNLRAVDKLLDDNQLVDNTVV